MSMKHFAVILFFLLAVLTVRSEDHAAHLELDSAYLDLGTVVADSVVEGTMHFRNVGDSPLKITRIFTDCGCTVPSYPKESIAPGGEGVIKVLFNSKGRMPGAFRKALRIRSTADNSRETLIIKGRVSPK